MIATDANILVYAHRADSQWHDRARACIETLARGRINWGLPWPCLHEFLAIVTHPRIYDPPSTAKQAIDQVEAWLASPVVELIAEIHDHWPVLKSQLINARVAGPIVHDAKVASVCLAHGVTELWTADRDFSRFPELPVRNPLNER